MFNGTIVLAGDVNLRRYRDFDESSLDNVEGALKVADVRLGNLEGAFASSWDTELFFKPGWYDAQPEMATCLSGRFDVVGCANNVHYGEAIAESSKTLDDLGILHTGSGRDLEAAHSPAVFSSAAGTVGVLAYTSVFEPVGHAATASAAGVATIRAFTAYEPNPRVLQMPGAPAVTHTWADAGELARACADVERLRVDVDVVVVYLHFGVSMSPVVHGYQREIAHALIDAGAAIVVGSHSHTLGGVEFYGDGVVFYSLGNFIFNAGFHPSMTRDGALAKVEFQRNRLDGCSLRPVYRDETERATFPELDSRDGTRLSAMISERCREFATRATVSEHELVLSP